MKNQWRGIVLLAPILAVAVILPGACKPKDAPIDKPATMPGKGDLDSKDLSFLGLTESEAAVIVKERGLNYRILSVDGEHRPMTMDYQHDRVNFTFEKGKITKVTRG